MSETDPFAQINAETRARIVSALGELTLQNISNGVRADHFQAAYQGMENSYAALAAEIDKLKAEITKASPVPQDFALPERDAAVHDDPMPSVLDDPDVGYQRRAPGVGD